MANVKRNLPAVIAAIKGSSGIKSTIARNLGVDRNSIDSYLKRWAEARKVYQEEVDGVGDKMESIIIIDAIRNQSVGTAKWYARFKLKDRGYVERQELTGADGHEVTIRVVYADSGNPAKTTS